MTIRHSHFSGSLPDGSVCSASPIRHGCISARAGRDERRARSGAGASRIPHGGVSRGTTPTAAPAPAPAAPAAPAIVEPLGDAFRIGPEDVLDVQVWKNPELSRVIPVAPTA